MTLWTMRTSGKMLTSVTTSNILQMRHRVQMRGVSLVPAQAVPR